MTTASQRPDTKDLTRPPGCEPSVLFELIWVALSELLGSAATATLIRRSVKRAVPRAPTLGGITVTKERFEYQYQLPPSWSAGSEHPEKSFEDLRELVQELRPILVELTGPVVIHRLYSIPDLERCRLLTLESDR
ncbi:MAG: hypothetical protein ACT4TC_21370 [Myxococcaceae bacterium]